MENWEDGALLFVEQSPAADFFWLESGVVELVSSSAEGKEKVVEIMQAGDLFAEGVAFMGGRYPVSARCSGAVRVLRIPFAPVVATRTPIRNSCAASLPSSACVYTFW